MRFGSFEERYASRDSARIALLPVPYDGTSTWIKGADRGPAALLSASPAVELYDIETGAEVYRLGIHTAPPVRESRSPERVIQAVRARVAALADEGKFVVTIGGEHSVSIGAIEAHAARRPGMCVLQLDAHSDLRDEYRGSRYNHGCVMARARELCPIVQVGVRSMDRSEKARMRPGALFLAKDLQDDDRWMPRAIRRLSKDVYLTIDLDALDPSIMPSTGTPEPGGLLWYPLLRLLRRLFRERNVVGFDIVELCPNEHNRGPDFLAAKLLYTLLSYRFCDAPARRRKTP